MDLRQRTQLMELYRLQPDTIPEWARAEQLERSMPLKEILEIREDRMEEADLWSNAVSRIRRWMKKHTDQKKRSDRRKAYLRPEGIA